MNAIEMIFATHNQHKLTEIRQIVQIPLIGILGLKEIGFYDDIPETADTLEGNALIKARTIFAKTGKNVFSEDTGLEVVALKMQPGVHTARYAGEGKDNNDNMIKLLHELENASNRKARFRTVIALILNEKEHLFEGEIWGVIAKKKSGRDGFGYDPIFIPDGYDASFAELSSSIKNTISHRYMAVIKMVEFLKLHETDGL